MASKRTFKKSVSKVSPKTAERIVTISLQHPELGARRLVPLLKKKRITVPYGTVQSILRRQGLQNREKRLAMIKKRAPKARKPKSPPKKPSTKITDEVAERIVETALQNPNFGAKRLLPLLKQQGIITSASIVYRILKRRGLQTREKRLAKVAEAAAEPMIIPKTFADRIPPEVEDRIVELSLQNPDYGTRRLMPLLQQEEILVSNSAVYKILKRNKLENKQKRLLKLEAQQVLDTPPAPELEEPEPVPEPVEPVMVAHLEPERPPTPRKAPKKSVKKRGNWVFYPLYLLLLILIGYLGLHAVQTVRFTWLEAEKVSGTESATVGIAARIESPASVGPIDGYRQIWERNLFNIPTPKDPELEKKFSLDQLAPADKDLGLELVGTVVANDPKMSRAIIDNRSIRKQEAYREGDTAGKVKIKKILRNNVVITTANGDELLTVEIKESGMRSTPYTPAQQIGSQSPSAQQTSGSPRSSGRTLSLSLKRDEVAASLADIDLLMDQLKPSPYMQGEQPSGFRLGSIPRDSVLRKMGLRYRDVIIGVDDENITGPEQAADFFKKLAEGGEVTIKLKRRYRTRQIQLHIE